MMMMLINIIAILMILVVVASFRQILLEMVIVFEDGVEVVRVRKTEPLDLLHGRIRILAIHPLQRHRRHQPITEALPHKTCRLLVLI